MGDQAGAVIRRVAAGRYAAWLQEELDKREWQAADLSRRSGLSKQLISQILNKEKEQPTAWQIAAIARGLRVPPTVIFVALGLWDETESVTMPEDYQQIYYDLSFPARRALLGAGRAIRELDREYATVERRAAFHNPGLAAHMHNDAESYGE